MFKKVWYDLLLFLYRSNEMGNQQEIHIQTLKHFPLSNKYLVSTLGEVISVKSGRHIKSTNHKGGYLRLGLVTDEGRKKFLLHRVVAITFIPNPENKPEVNHIDGNKHNNSVDNLEWVTREENQHHAFSNNLNHNRGTNNGRCILTEKDVINIYNLLLIGDRQVDISRLYDVDVSTIANIKRKKNWAEILKDLPDIKLNHKSKSLTQLQIERCKKLRIQGYTCKGMAELMGITLGQAEVVFRTKKVKV